MNHTLSDETKFVENSLHICDLTAVMDLSRNDVYKNRITKNANKGISRNCWENYQLFSGVNNLEKTWNLSSCMQRHKFEQVTNF